MSIKLYYPYTGVPTYNITLKNPAKGDSLIHNTNFITHIMMDKSINTYNRSTTRKLLLTFSNLTTSEIEDLEDFYLNIAGSFFGYRDYNGQNWVSTFLNNPFEYSINSGQGSCEMGDVTLQLTARKLTTSTIYLIDDDGNYLVDDVGNNLITAGD